MKIGRVICMNFVLLVFSLLCLFSLEFTFMGMADSVKLNLIKEEQLNMKPGSGNDLFFLGRPEYISPSQGRFAPVLSNDQKTKQDVIREEGADIIPPWIPYNENVFINNVIYNPKNGIIGYVYNEIDPNRVEIGNRLKHQKFVIQNMEGRILWQVEYTYLADARMSQIGTVFIIRQDLVDSPSGSSGIYVFNIHNGHLLSAFEDPNILIDNYIFSGDNSRLIFEYEVVNWDQEKTEEEFLNPKSHLACIDANGRLIWDIEVKPIRNLSISYHGDRLIYITESPNTLLELKLGKKLYTRAGLIDGSGHILWELDNPSGVGVDLTPSGEYYQMVLYSDQSNMWDTTDKKEPVYYCLFESLSHKNIWRNELETLVPQLKEGWYTIGAGTISLDNQWIVFVFSNYQSGHLMQGGSGPIRNLLILKNFLTNEIVYQQELDKEVYKVLISPDSKIIELLFWDGHRMLFERIP